MIVETGKRSIADDTKIPSTISMMLPKERKYFLFYTILKQQTKSQNVK
jgi:hypothetical protein